MSHTTPHVEHGRLNDKAGSIALETPEWYSWLAEEQHRSFHFCGHGGEFTARKERKQRGDWYWVAYRQVHGKLFKTYLGKAERLTDDHLQAAAHALHALAAAENASNTRN